jgi:ribosomal protein L36
MRLAIALLCCFVHLSGVAQTIIQGVVKRKVEDSSGSQIVVRNVNTNTYTYTDSIGNFSISIHKGDLLEFTNVSLETARVRITNEKNPKFYYIEMRPKVKELGAVVAKGKSDYTTDSLNTIATYRTVFAKPLREEYTAGAGIMASLSKKQREEWEFRQKTIWWEQQKYIDYRFGERPIAKMTGLTDDRLREFIQIYKPSYYDLRQMNEYRYLLYVKTSLKQFCEGCEFVAPRR